MIVLGLDPGYATVGYGVIDHKSGSSRLIAYGAVTTAPGLPLACRLSEIYNDVVTLIETYKPDSACVEELFFNTNVKTAIQVGHARGVILLACQQCGVEPAEYTPLQVKQAVVGYGRAEKRQVMEMVRIMLNLDAIPKPDDAADALAIAICHAHSSTSRLNI